MESTASWDTAAVEPTAAVTLVVAGTPLGKRKAFTVGLSGRMNFPG